MKAPAAVTANRNISPMLSVNQKKKLAKINYILHHVLNAAECRLGGCEAEFPRQGLFFKTA